LVTFYTLLGDKVHSYVFCYPRSGNNREGRPFEALILSDHKVLLNGPYFRVWEAPEFFEQLKWWIRQVPWSGKGMLQALNVEMRQRRGERFGVFLLRRFTLYRDHTKNVMTYRRGPHGHIALAFPGLLAPAPGSIVEEVGCLTCDLLRGTRRGRLVYHNAPLKMTFHTMIVEKGGTNTPKKF